MLLLIWSLLNVLLGYMFRMHVWNVDLKIKLSFDFVIEKNEAQKNVVWAE